MGQLQYRTSSKYKKLTPSVVLFNNPNWLDFTKQSLIKRCALVYKRVHNYMTPSYLNIRKGYFYTKGWPCSTYILNRIN